MGKLFARNLLKTDPLEDILRVQTEYVHRLVPQIQAIWNREKVGRGKLKAATFEDYQILLGEEGQPELYHRDRLLMGYSKGNYQGYGLTEQDCSAIAQFNEQLRQQALSQQLDPAAGKPSNRAIPLPIPAS